MSDNFDRGDFDRELRDFAQLGEQGADDGWSADRVRRLGARRHTRRVVATGIAAALAVVTLGGGVVYSATLHGDRPDPAQSPSMVPTVTATPARTLATGNLLRTSDIGTQTADQQIVIADPSLGRDVAHSSVCLSDGLDPLGATQILSRNFDLITTGPDAVPSDHQPIVYTQALQFADAPAADRAYATYQGWLKQCRQAIVAAGGKHVTDPAPELVTVETGVSGARGVFTEWNYQAKGQSNADGGTFESVGLTVLADRMMVTVNLVTGMDHNVSFTQDDPKADLPPHEQFGLIKAAAQRLG